MNVLIVAPHPDDEVLGCGGVIARHSQAGDDVTVLVMTRGTPRIWSAEQVSAGREEARKAHALLGVKETIFFEYLAPELDQPLLSEISMAINQVLRRKRTELLYVPHRGDIHNDHRVVDSTALVAARPVGDYTVRKILAYETLSETEWAPPFGDDAFIPTEFVNIESQLEKKKQAMACFVSQLKAFPNPRSLDGIEHLARLRGTTVGFRAAESFMLVRNIVA
jgi:LmbE family N-acetylglucosaminyl deacetylase